ncbi:MAG: hypothetical protein K2X27_13000 [Candidatus Obscuribacterales bacterium]|nr:hypothetical protein [Candidatus Obscuribacterales bacterium]
MTGSIVVTLFEKHYQAGVAALVNSLYLAGFRGEVWAGFRGDLPDWAKSAVQESVSTFVFKAAEGLNLRFIKLETEQPLYYYKARFFYDVLRQNQEFERLFYFDPDIVVTERWQMFEDWIKPGLALSLDYLYALESTNPKRNVWIDFCKSRNIEILHNFDVYLNSGFIGIDVRYAEFLKQWERLNLEIVAHIGSTGLKHGNLNDAFHMPDQDALNIALMTTDVPYSFADAMGFRAPHQSNYMYHAMGRRKPWQSNKILATLRNEVPISISAERAFFRFCREPISIYSPLAYELMQLDRKISVLLDRLFRGKRP